MRIASSRSVGHLHRHLFFSARPLLFLLFFFFPSSTSPFHYTPTSSIPNSFSIAPSRPLFSPFSLKASNNSLPPFATPLHLYLFLASSPTPPK
ncbi:hypothetical protein BJY00DRAFT_30646 [Aspergillus carlsbadensis]|nr:hypothetical protein BJY00DRAFT_30646 [Aspergillus carlsbadensis]